jgi:beta-1,4-N-acetylglucosaminyltransferase
LNLQIGRGEEPTLPQPSVLKIVWYRLKDNISSDIQNASLVISHAGAGSCTEILRASKPLIVVVNDTLMGNHQVELAEQLHQDKHAHMCYPQTLCSALKEVEVNQFVQFPAAKTSNFSNFLESLMGFS